VDAKACVFPLSLFFIFLSLVSTARIHAEDEAAASGEIRINEDAKVAASEEGVAEAEYEKTEEKRSVIRRSHGKEGR
jgi:hypothetical protein